MKQVLSFLTQHPLRIAVGVGLLSVVSVLIFQGKPYLFDWDELIYASLARQMVLSGDWLSLLINQEPFWEKPPFFFWLQAISFKSWGISEASARFPSALAYGGLITGLVWMGVRVHSLRFGLIWSLLLSTSFLPLLFSKTCLIDPTFNLAMLVGLGGIFIYERQLQTAKPRLTAVIVVGIALGTAVLIKGPLGWGLPVILWILFKVWHRTPWRRYDWLGFGLISGGVATSWFVLEIGARGPEFILEFAQYQWRILSTAEGHQEPIYFHLVIYALGCYPFASLSATEMGSQLQVLWMQLRSRSQTRQPLPNSDFEITLTQFNHFMLVNAGVVLGLFSIVVQTKLIHYSSLLYPFGSYFATHRVLAWIDKKSQPSLLETLWIAVSGLLLTTLLLGIPWVGYHADQFKSLLSDPLSQDYLATAVEWPIWSFIPGGILLMGLLIGLGLLRSRRLVPGGLCLLFATWLAGQLSWGWLGSRVLEYTQGGSIHYFESLATASMEVPTVALFGFKSFVPYFYGDLRVPYATTLDELQEYLDQEPTIRYLVTWSPFELDLIQQSQEWTSLSLKALDQKGAFVLMQVQRAQT